MSTPSMMTKTTKTTKYDVKNKIRSKQYRNRCIGQGKCPQCGKYDDLKGRYCCSACLKKRREQDRRRYLRRKEAVCADQGAGQATHQAGET